MSTVSDLLNKQLPYQSTKEEVEATLSTISRKLEKVDPFILDMLIINKLCSYLLDTASSTTSSKVWITIEECNGNTVHAMPNQGKLFLHRKMQHHRESPIIYNI